MQVIAQVARLTDGSRRITEISEVNGLAQRNGQERYRVKSLFRFERTATTADDTVVGELRPTGHRSRFAREVMSSALGREVDLTAPIFGEKSDADPSPVAVLGG